MKKSLFITTVAALFFFTSCKKEFSDNFTSYSGDPRNDTVWVTSTPATAPIHQLANQFLPDLIIDTLIAHWVTPSHSKTIFPYAYQPHPLQKIQGHLLQVKYGWNFFRLKKKGDFIKFFKPTTSSGYLVESGGGFFIRVIKNGQELKLGT